MPHFLRLSRDLEARLERLGQATGLGKSALIERCLAEGLASLEQQHLAEPPSRPETSIDQRLRESGLGA